MIIKILYTSGNIQHLKAKSFSVTKDYYAIIPENGETKFIDNANVLEIDIVENKD